MGSVLRHRLWLVAESIEGVYLKEDFSVLVVSTVNVGYFGMDNILSVGPAVEGARLWGIRNETLQRGSFGELFRPRTTATF